MPALVSGFHEGEAAMRAELRVPAGMNPTTPGLPMYYGARISSCPLVAIGTLDDEGRPWTTVWGGERGFAGMVAQGVLGFKSGVDTANDPVYEAFWQGQKEGMVRPEEAKMMSALAIDLEGRDRVKLGGAMVAGSAEGGEVQMAMVVAESLGNCPKYLNKKAVAKREVKDATVQDGPGLPLGEDALRLVRSADAFFMSSTNGETMDTNYRGGGRGFVRVVKNDADGVVLVYPEYSGNRLYQSLGNLKVKPLAGIVIPDFNTSDVLYLTGSTTILVGKQASSVIARTNLAVQITITAARFVKAGLPFRGTNMEESPYNPPIRHLVVEKEDHVTEEVDQRRDVTASLAKREEITPNIYRYAFTLSEALDWEAGQHVSLDFKPELDMGYEHMNDGDPQSLNDDFVRTFTVSSAPDDAGKRIEITARTNGPATNFLKRHNTRVPLELGVLGFGGEAAFRMPTIGDGKRAVFVAGGVGITPLLAQARAVLDGNVNLELLWSVNKADIGLVRDVMGRIDGLKEVTRLYVTGGELEEQLDVKELHGRRMIKEDIDKVTGQDVKLYVCAGQTLSRTLDSWLEGQDVVREDFSY